MRVLERAFKKKISDVENWGHKDMPVKIVFRLLCFLLFFVASDVYGSGPIHFIEGNKKVFPILSDGVFYFDVPKGVYYEVYETGLLKFDVYGHASFIPLPSGLGWSEESDRSSKIILSVARTGEKLLVLVRDTEYVYTQDGPTTRHGRPFPNPTLVTFDLAIGRWENWSYPLKDIDQKLFYTENVWLFFDEVRNGVWLFVNSDGGVAGDSKKSAVTQGLAFYRDQKGRWSDLTDKLGECRQQGEFSRFLRIGGRIVIIPFIGPPVLTSRNGQSFVQLQNLPGSFSVREVLVEDDVWWFFVSENGNSANLCLYKFQEKGSRIEFIERFSPDILYQGVDKIFSRKTCVVCGGKYGSLERDLSLLLEYQKKGGNFLGYSKAAHLENLKALARLKRSGCEFEEVSPGEIIRKEGKFIHSNFGKPKNIPVAFDGWELLGREMNEIYYTKHWNDIWSWDINRGTKNKIAGLPKLDCCGWAGVFWKGKAFVVGNYADEMSGAPFAFKGLFEIDLKNKNTKKLEYFNGVKGPVKIYTTRNGVFAKGGKISIDLSAGVKAELPKDAVEAHFPPNEISATIEKFSGGRCLVVAEK